MWFIQKAGIQILIVARERSERKNVSFIILKAQEVFFAVVRERKNMTFIILRAEFQGLSWTPHRGCGV